MHTERLQYWRSNPPKQHQIVREKEKLDQLRAFYYDYDLHRRLEKLTRTASGRFGPVEKACEKIQKSRNPVEHFDEFKASLEYLLGHTDQMRDI